MVGQGRDCQSEKSRILTLPLAPTPALTISLPISFGPLFGSCCAVDLHQKRLEHRGNQNRARRKMHEDTTQEFSHQLCFSLKQ